MKKDLSLIYISKSPQKHKLSDLQVNRLKWRNDQIFTPKMDKTHKERSFSVLQR